jgi:N-dimethylarginine dimethylaminohydrolase
VLACNEFSRLTRVVVKHPRDAFVDRASVARQWQDLGFAAAPDLPRALDEYEQFLRIIESGGAEILTLPASGGTGLDSIYTRDAAVVCPQGVVPCRMGKPQRDAEPAAQMRAFEAWGLPVAGTIQPPGSLEGGDVVWFDERTVAVGRGYRTNDEGIAQLGRMVGPGVEVMTVPLPHWQGPGDVFHLMSIISAADRDLAVVYSPLLPVPFREWLRARDVELVEVPDEEFASMGANVLAIAPRVCVVMDGNPRTRARLEEAGADVRVYAGQEISLKGGGGPTCLTRPIERELP